MEGHASLARTFMSSSVLSWAAPPQRVVFSTSALHIALVHACGSLDAVTSLDLSYCILTDADMVVLRDAARPLERCTCMNLSGNRLLGYSELAIPPAYVQEFVMGEPHAGAVAAFAVVGLLRDHPAMTINLIGSVAMASCDMIPHLFHRLDAEQLERLLFLEADQWNAEDEDEAPTWHRFVRHHPDGKAAAEAAIWAAHQRHYMPQ